jgi:hypothetical protein
MDIERVLVELNGQYSEVKTMHKLKREQIKEMYLNGERPSKKLLFGIVILQMQIQVLYTAIKDAEELYEKRSKRTRKSQE